MRGPSRTGAVGHRAVDARRTGRPGRAGVRSAMPPIVEHVHTTTVAPRAAASVMASWTRWISGESLTPTRCASRNSGSATMCSTRRLGSGGIDQPIECLHVDG